MVVGSRLGGRLAQLTCRRVAPRPCRGLVRLSCTGPDPLQFISGGVRGSGQAAAALSPPGQPVNSQVSLSEVWLGRRPQASEVREWWAPPSAAQIKPTPGPPYGPPRPPRASSPPPAS